MVSGRLRSLETHRNDSTSGTPCIQSEQESQPGSVGRPLKAESVSVIKSRLMSTEHLLCASTMPDTGTTSLSYPKGAHGAVWSAAGHPGSPDPSPSQPAAFPLPKSAYYQSLRELQGTATKHPGRERDSLLSQSGVVPALCSHPHSQAAVPENRVWVKSHTIPSSHGHPSSWRSGGCLAPARGWSKSCCQAIHFSGRGQGQSLMGSRPFSSNLC